MSSQAQNTVGQQLPPDTKDVEQDKGKKKNKNGADAGIEWTDKMNNLVLDSRKLIGSDKKPRRSP